MPTITCSQCGMEYEDDVLLCPHCGTAQIPQLSKAEVRMKALRASAGPYGVSLAGTGIGLLFGAIVLTIAALRGANAEALLQYAAGMLIAGMLGGAAGLAVHYYFLTDRREREKYP